MKEKIDWRKEILESRRFNSKFEENLLEDGAKNLKGYYKFDPKENTGQMQSSLKEFWKRTK